jgi:hypothetical protein
MKKFKNSGQFKPLELIPGSKYNSWTVLGTSLLHHSGGNTFWHCQCDCGVVKNVSASRVVNGKSKSCGCYRRRKGQNIKHGLKNHPLYSKWNNMKGRCYNPSYHNYPDYGGRGIIVCDRWLNSFKDFYDDVVEGWAHGLHLGRIDNNGNYEPGNWKWDTPIESAGNKRNTMYVCHDGRTHTVAEWARRLLLKADTIRNRIRKGKSGKEALFGNNSLTLQQKHE